MTDLIFEEFYRLHYNPLVKKTSFKTEGKVEDAEDIVQEAFTRAWKYRDSFNEEKTFINWFGKILSNSYKDWKREKYNHPRMEDFVEENLELIVDPENKESIFKILLKIEDEDSGEKKEILRLHFIHGFSYVEITEIMNLPYTRVLWAIKSFKSKMRS